jgi:hypothetical protein
MSRRIAWFSSGAASAVATKLSNPDVIVMCDTGSEDADNMRFLHDCVKWLGQSVEIINSTKYKNTWDVWERKQYISGIKGAPCTGALKIEPRLKFQREDDIHIFGYTCDKNDVNRAEALRDNWPDLNIETPLIERGLTKAACLAMIEGAGIKPPRVYAMGFPNANCIPCCKATSPAYWALIRKEFPDEFERMNVLSRKLSARLARVNNERVFIDEVPMDQETTEPLAPYCDFLCQLAIGDNTE